NEQQGQLEPARLDGLDQVVDRRRGRALLPARDHRTLTARPLSQLRLGQPGTQPRLTNQRPTTHRRSLHEACFRHTTHISYTNLKEISETRHQGRLTWSSAFFTSIWRGPTTRVESASTRRCPTWI